MARSTGLTRAAAVVLLAAGLAGCSGQKESDRMGSSGQPHNAPRMSEQGDPSGPAGQGLETATFAAGCFWGVEAAFRNVEGVVSTTVGYTGGHTEHPSYEDVCTDRTGHAESVQVVFDPKKVSYEQLLTVFWGCHNPTTANRQGPDFGSQYRSAIFTHSPEQEAAARASLAKQAQSGRFGRPIVTQIVPAGPFWRAEEYHQQYLAKHGQDACASTVRQ